MKDVKWLVNRLRAMNVSEIAWRIQQKMLQQKEKRVMFEFHLPVTEIPLSKEIGKLKIKAERLQLNWENQACELFSNLDLFEMFSYDVYKKEWNAGFQSKENWPEEDFSYTINVSQREDIGDIRTNWELNRHFQFSALAKNYYISGKLEYLNELEELFEDWNIHNLFLHGVSWTSAMEIAIRANSWMYTYCFLEKAFQKHKYERKSLLDKLQNGILAMISYVVKHRARYSSANNHLIVEMYAVALAGILTGYSKWIQLAISILSKEISLQNYSDGVNKEMSLHYQCFVMEAYGLLMHTMKKNSMSIPNKWYEYLQPMSEFVADCYGNKGEVIVFGDSDEGKILDLNGYQEDYYKYVLDLMSTLMPMKYTEFDCVHENLNWILEENTHGATKCKERYVPKKIECYKEGGYTLIRAKEGRILIGIDHAELGFGKIAAHGHADALSFQMFVDGNPFIVDPGTYNYHFIPKLRNEIRNTSWHNTVSISGKNQSEILGPFLWGNRCKCNLIESSWNKDIFCQAKAEYGGLEHKRTFTSLNEVEFLVHDQITEKNSSKKSQIFMIHPACEVSVLEQGIVKIQQEEISIYLENKSNAVLNMDKYWYSSKYCHFKEAVRVAFSTESDVIETRIKVEMNEERK